MEKLEPRNVPLLGHITKRHFTKWNLICQIATIVEVARINCVTRATIVYANYLNRFHVPKGLREY